MHFFEGDTVRLEDSLALEILKDLNRPFLEVDDWPHKFYGCLVVLNLFHMHLEPEDIVDRENGHFRDFRKRYLGISDGLRRALKKVMRFHSNQYSLGTDFYPSTGEGPLRC